MVLVLLINERYRMTEDFTPAVGYKARYNNEMKEVVGRWERTSLLQNLDDPYIQGQIALMMENQRLMNEVLTDTDDIATFKRVSIPLVRRVYNPHAFLAWDLVSVQTLLGPAGYIYRSEQAKEIYALTKKLKTLWQPELLMVDVRSRRNHLDEEAKLTAQLALAISEEINYEIIDDLRNNTCLTTEVRDEQEPYRRITCISYSS